MKPEKSKPIGILVGNLFVLVIVIGTLLTLLAVTGCDEAGQMMAPVIGNEPADTVPPVMVGEVKEDPEETPTEPTTTEPEEPTDTPQEPADTESPSVMEVGWYSDWRLMDELTIDSAVHPGETVFIKVVFSEPVQHTVADDESARPALSFVLDGQATQFRVAAHGAHGEDFLSGDCKPLHDGTDDYLCKVTLPADIVGTLALEVGTETTDAASNPAAAAVHTAPFMAEMRPEPDVTIDAVETGHNGSITVSGTSIDVPAKTTVVVEIDDSVVGTTTTDESGNWTVIISTVEARRLTPGMAMVTASTAGASDSSPVIIEEPEPEPTPPAVTEPVQPVEVGSEYTFTLEGLTYPGYNPPPKLQHILNTHPSAQLPNFAEAVKITEVMDWVYLMVWEVYPGDAEKMVAARRRAKDQFGLTREIDDNLLFLYEDFLGHYPNSRYWFYVECFRLLLTHPEWSGLRSIREEEYKELEQQFKLSLKEGHIVGQTNPHRN